ncbi:large extracellular alpha-helical protein [Microbacterium jejuense]|uniref:Large extracellular alpha-helical protein n=1 Tax=Microbacterium jejuense TaxID=1263637 RepID=A0ABS7HS05_9MICO|nr:DUF5719 family protein [Microbacterium jejuense]MBW9095736.1 large extracellular alpha-helical protein [Microbacterium jejuense]
MSDRRVFRWATTSARLLIGTAVSVIAVIAVVTAVTVPWPTIAREPVRIATTPAPAASIVTCDGALLSIGRNSEDASSLALAARQTVVTGVQEGAAEPQQQTLKNDAVGEGPLTLTAPPEAGSAVDVAAAGAATARADDLAGFAASACRPPLLESWLVGGSGATGAADLVLLSNPGTVAATVQLTVYGVGGPQTPPGGSDLLVAPGTQRVVPLAGIALGEESPVVRVSAVGAPIHASLQASITRTLTPGGVDQVGPIAAPAAQQVIAGVAVTRTPAQDGSEGATKLRMLSPSVATTARVVVTAAGRTEPARASQEISLEPGQPLELELDGLAAGSYTVSIDADTPIVAAVWQTTGFGEGDDFAWYTPSPEVAASTLFVTPSGPVPTLTVVNPGTEPADVKLAAQGGGFEVDLSVPAGGSTTVRLSPRTVYVIDPSDPVRAGLSLTGDGALAGIPVWPADVAAHEVVVYP